MNEIPSWREGGRAALFDAHRTLSSSCGCRFSCADSWQRLGYLFTPKSSKDVQLGDICLTAACKVLGYLP